MALRLHNTLSRELETFEPREPPHVRIYACGPTVYQAPHIGNYRFFIFNDLLHRYLEWKGFRVTFVMNLTDVDDKTIDNALRQAVSLNEFTSPVIRAFFDDLSTLGIRPADLYPRATEHIDEMVALIERLIERGHAYTADGSVYFDISSFPQYGRLSRIELDQVRRGQRVAADEYQKEDARDFALWKATRDADRRVGAVWPTPWGDGRPGWHLECSAMSMAELGDTLDIHTGGEDLVFPHHEDEIAQSESATGQPFVRYWLHVKHLLVEGEKMAKSLGNQFSVSDLLARDHSAAAIRYLLLSAHYRRELNFTFDSLHNARAALRRLLDFDARLSATPVDSDAPESPLRDLAANALHNFERALDDDLNTPAALAALFTFVREANAALDRAETIDPAGRDAATNVLASSDQVLGVLQLARTTTDTDDALAEWIDEQIERRRKARSKRDFAAADTIRDELAAQGIVLEDTPGGTRWKRTP